MPVPPALAVEEELETIEDGGRQAAVDPFGEVLVEGAGEGERGEHLVAVQPDLDFGNLGVREGLGGEQKEAQERELRSHREQESSTPHSPNPLSPGPPPVRRGERGLRTAPVLLFSLLSPAGWAEGRERRAGEVRAYGITGSST